MGCPRKCGYPLTRRKLTLRMITVEPILFLYMFGSNLQFPTFQALVYEKTCKEHFNGSFCDDMDNKTFQKIHQKEQDLIQSDSNYWIMLSNVGMTVPSILVVSLFVGSWGDKTRVGIVESMTFFAGTISVFVSGLLLNAVGYVAVFGIVCGCVGVASLYGIFWLESIRPEPGDQRESCCRIWFLGAVSDTLRCVLRPRMKPYLIVIILEIAVLGIMQMCTTGENDILYLFLKRSPRSFTSVQYGYFKGTENFTRSIALLTLLPLLKHVFHLRDTTLVIIGISSKAAGLIILGLAENLTMVFIVVVFAMLQGFPAAGLRSSMSGLVDKDEQGRLFAIVAATESCVTMVTTLVFNGWYSKTLDTFDGTCFEFAAGLCGLAILITIYVHLKLRSADNKDGSLEHLGTDGETVLETSVNSGKYTLPHESVTKTRL